MKTLQKKPLKRWIKWVYCLLPLLIAVILYWLLPHLPYVTEYVFARGIFRVVGTPLNFLVSIFPFSLTEIALVLGVASFVIFGGSHLFRTLKNQKNRLAILEKGARTLCAILSVATFMYMILHGANYHRLPVDELFSLHNGTYDAAFLFDVTADLAKKASAAREQTAEDENGCMQLSHGVTDALKCTDDCYKNLKKQYPFLHSGTWRIKGVALSKYWSYTGITGVYCPWLAESNVNVDIPHNEIPFTAAHEYAHSLGFAREDACNFIAYVACITSDIPDYTYAGYLNAYIYCSNALYRYNPELCKQAAAYCSKAVQRDLYQRNRYWDAFRGDVMDASEKANDTFIKANGVQSGVLSYTQAVSLILRYYDTNNLITQS